MSDDQKVIRAIVLIINIILLIITVLLVIELSKLYYYIDEGTITCWILYLTILIILLLLGIIVSFIIIFTNDDNSTDSDDFNNVLKSSESMIVGIDKYKLLIKDNKFNLDLYNLSVIKSEEKDMYLGLVRGHNKTNSYSHPLYIELNNAGEIQKLELLNFDSEDFTICSNRGIEDPRIFIFKNELWGIGNCLGYKDQKIKCINTMCIFKLSNPKDTLKLLYHENNNIIQKNWSPFEYDNKLYCEYSIDPHVIYEINPNTGNNNNIIKSSSDFQFKILSTKGRLSGGSSPILISHFKTKVYLNIGHVRLVNHSYYHFFYMFERHPPFNIIGMSEIFKLETLNERIQFACGLSIQDDIVHISYGINDKSNMISTFNIYDINNMIQYDHKYIMTSLIKEKDYKLVIIAKDKSEELTIYCEKHGYELFSCYENIHHDLLKYPILYLNDSSWEMNLDQNFDDIFNIAGCSEYIAFEGFRSYIICNTNLKFDNIVKFCEFVKSDILVDDYTKIIRSGYPYRGNKGIIFPTNYLNKIFMGQSLRSIENDQIIMPNLIINNNKITNNKIPKIIHQSFESRLLPECLVAAAHTWINLNPDYEYKYYDNGDRRKLIVDNFNDDVVKAYDMLIPGAYRCDLFRFCAIYLYGGIYVDIKIGAFTSMNNIIDHDVDYLLINDINDYTMCNGIFGAKVKDPIILKVIGKIAGRVLNKKYGKHNLYPTGPLAMGSVILKAFNCDKHMKIGKYEIDKNTVCVYDRHPDGDHKRIIVDKNNKVLINTRHNPKTLDQEFLTSITGNPNYGILWEERRIYRNI